jgi:hypothetical protein
MTVEVTLKQPDHTPDVLAQLLSSVMDVVVIIVSYCSCKLHKEH